MALKIQDLDGGNNGGLTRARERHAKRELDIHRSLQHPLIVALLDIFELDANSFVTVMELCTGGDLDCHLRDHTVRAPLPFDRF